MTTSTTKTWLECDHCKGLFWVVNPGVTVSDYGTPIDGDHFSHRDGTPLVDGELIACDDCGIIQVPRGDQVRTGKKLPAPSGWRAA